MNKVSTMFEENAVMAYENRSLPAIVDAALEDCLARMVIFHEGGPFTARFNSEVARGRRCLLPPMLT
jgi:hypothetical protein